MHVGKSPVVLLLATLLLGAKAPEELQGKYRSRVARDQGQLDSPTTRAGALKDLSAVVQELETLSLKYPDDAWIHQGAAYALRALKKGGDAVAEVDAAARLAPDDAGIVYFQGHVHAEAGDLEAAGRLLERAAKLDPDRVGPLEELGHLRLQQERYAEARTVLEKACAMKDADPETFLDLASALDELGAYEAALAAEEEALGRDPDNVAAHFDAGIELTFKGDFAGALRHFEAAARLKPDDPRIWSKLVQSYQSVGRRDLRDAARAKMLGFHRSGKTKAKEFGREQFPLGDHWVYAMEMFEPEAPFRVLYRFDIMAGPHGHQPIASFELESADMDQRYAKESDPTFQGKIFTLDENLPNGNHATYQFFRSEPSYEEVRTLVVQSWTKQVAPISSLSTGGGGK